MFGALPFVSIKHLQNALQGLSDALPNESMMILNYFEDNYIGRLQQNHQRRRSMFELALLTRIINN